MVASLNRTKSFVLSRGHLEHYKECKCSDPYCRGLWKLSLAQCLVFLMLQYCLYGNGMVVENCDMIRKIRIAAIRFVYNISIRYRVSYFRWAANIMPIETVCKKHTCLVKLVLTGGIPDLADSFFIGARFHSELPSRITRFNIVQYSPQ